MGWYNVEAYKIIFYVIYITQKQNLIKQKIYIPLEARKHPRKSSLSLAILCYMIRIIAGFKLVWAISRTFVICWRNPNI